MSRQLPSRTEASSFLFLLCQPRDHFKGDDLDVLRAVANTLATQSGSRMSGEQPSHARDKLCSSYSIESNRFQFLDLSLSLSLSLFLSQLAVTTCVCMGCLLIKYLHLLVVAGSWHLMREAAAAGCEDGADIKCLEFEVTRFLGLLKRPLFKL